jgi:hypothetical protein
LNDEIVIQHRALLSETQQKVQFSIEVSDIIKEKLYSLGVESVQSLPMTWISSDTPPHVDIGDEPFTKTILVYITDATGSIIIGDETYDISRNRAFSFEQGLIHSTLSTGTLPRLLIGPMGETGFPVGGTSIYYYSSVDDVTPDPIVATSVYTTQNQPTSTTNSFPSGATISPPYVGATVLYWNGKKGTPGFYTDVSYNPGDAWDSSEPNHVYPVWSQQPQIMCFKEDTKILCLDPTDNTEQYLPIQSLKKGTLVKTLASGYQPIQLIGHSKIYNSANQLRSKNRLYKCQKEQYPELTEDLIITGCHSILVWEITDKQRAELEEHMGQIFVTENRYRLMACIDEKALPYEKEGVFTIWHFALENDHDRKNYGVYANGLLVESSSIRMMSEYSGMELI